MTAEAQKAETAPDQQMAEHRPVLCHQQRKPVRQAPAPMRSLSAHPLTLGRQKSCLDLYQAF